MLTVLRCFGRYLAANVTMSAGWRQGPSSVPPEMHHRPRWFVQHMLDAEMKSQDITSDMVHTVADDVFRVQSATKVTKSYNVSLGNETSFPYCTCRQFVKLRMPCKHFCAVFHHVPTTSFSSLPERYRGHPMFVVDEEWVSGQQGVTAGEAYADDMSMPTVGRMATDVDEEDDDTAGTPHKLARDCRELATIITNYTYDVQSAEVLLQLKESLTSAAVLLQTSCPESGGLPLHGAASDTARQRAHKQPPASDRDVADTSTESTVGKRRVQRPRRADAKRAKTMKDFFPEAQVKDYTPADDNSAAATQPELHAYGLSV